MVKGNRQKRNERTAIGVNKMDKIGYHGSLINLNPQLVAKSMQHYTHIDDVIAIF